MFIKDNHNLLCAGVTNIGKTHYILDLLETKFRNHFEYIVLFCPTYLHNKTYDRKWIFKDKDFIIIDPKTVAKYFDETLEICSDIFKGSKTLFILDDIANLHDSKIKGTSLCNLAFSGRHYNISVWVLVQKYNSVIKDFRENIRFLILFYNKDKNAMKQALEENAIIPLSEHQNIIENLKENKGSKLLLRLEQPFEYLIIK